VAKDITAKVILDLLLRDKKALEELKKLNKTLKEINQSAKVLGGSFSKGQQVIRNEVDKSGQAVKKFGRTWQQTSRDFVRNGDAMIRVAKGLSIFLTVPMIAASGAAIKFAADFEHAFAEVRTILTATPGEVDALSNRLKKMATEVPQSLNELTKGLYQTISAGITETSEALTVLEQSAKAAVAGVSDTFTAVDALTTVLNAYKLSASDAERVSDILFTTVRLGKVVFPELAHSLGKVISTAALGKVPFEEIAAAMAVLTKNGIKADMASISLNQAMLAFIKPSVQAAKAAKKYGVNLSAAALSSGGLAHALAQLNKILLRMEEEGTDAIEVFGELATNVRALRAIASLAGGSFEEFNEAIKEMYDSAGATTTAFAIMEDTLKNKLAIALQTMQLAMVNFGETMTPFIESLAKVVTVMSTLLAMSGKAGPVIGGFAVVLLTVVTALGFAYGMLSRTIGVLRNFIVAENVATKASTTFATASMAAGLAADKQAASMRKMIPIFGRWRIGLSSLGLIMGSVVGGIMAIGLAIGAFSYYARKKRDMLAEMKRELIEYATAEVQAKDKAVAAGRDRVRDLDILRNKYADLRVTREVLGKTNDVLDDKEKMLEESFRNLMKETMDLKKGTYSLDEAVDILTKTLEDAAGETNELGHELSELGRSLASVQLRAMEGEYDKVMNSIGKTVRKTFKDIGITIWEERTDIGKHTKVIEQTLTRSVLKSLSILKEQGVKYADIIEVMEKRSLEGVEARMEGNAKMKESFETLLGAAEKFYKKYGRYQDEHRAKVAEVAAYGKKLSDEAENYTQKGYETLLKEQEAAKRKIARHEKELDRWDALLMKFKQIAALEKKRIELVEAATSSIVHEQEEVANLADIEEKKRELVAAAWHKYNVVVNRIIESGRGGMHSLTTSIDEVTDALATLRAEGQYEITDEAGTKVPTEEMAKLVGKLISLKENLEFEKLKLTEEGFKDAVALDALMLNELSIHYDNMLVFVEKHYKQRTDLITKYEKLSYETQRQYEISLLTEDINKLKEAFYVADAEKRLEISLEVAEKLRQIEIMELEDIAESTEKKMKKREQIYKQYMEDHVDASKRYSAEMGQSDERTLEVLLENLEKWRDKLGQTYGEMSGIVVGFNDKIRETQEELADKGSLALIRATEGVALTTEQELENLKLGWKYWYDEMARLHEEYYEDKTIGQREFERDHNAAMRRMLEIDKQYTERRIQIFENSLGPLRQLIQGTYDAISDAIFSFMQEQRDWNEAQHQMNLLNLRDEEKAIRVSYLNRELSYEAYNVQLGLLDQKRRDEQMKYEDAHRSWLEKSWDSLKGTWGSLIARLISEYLYMATIRLAIGEGLHTKEILMAMVGMNAEMAAAKGKEAAAIEVAAVKIAASKLERAAAIGVVGSTGGVVAGQEVVKMSLITPWPASMALIAPIIAAVMAQFAALQALMVGQAVVFASGGQVRGPGTGTSDSIPAWLSNGEYVINAAATRANRPLLEAINSGRKMASGGMVRVEASVPVSGSVASDAFSLQRETVLLLNGILNEFQQRDFSPQVNVTAETSISARGIHTLVKREDRAAEKRRLVPDVAK